MKNMKKMLASAGIAMALLTGCSSIGGVDFSQYALKQLEVSSIESKGVTTINIDYDAQKIKDQDTATLLKLFSNMKITAHLITDDQEDISIVGTLTLKKGDIPFKMTLTEDVLLMQLDNATKPIRIDTQTSDFNTDKEYLATLKKLVPHIVKHVPAPAKLEVTSKQATIQGETVNGKNLHMEIYGDELPNLVLGFMEGLSKDQEAIEMLVAALNEADGTTALTVESFKEELETLVYTSKQQLSLLKHDREFKQIFNKQNYMKIDTLLDNSLHERKSEATMHISLPGAEDSGIKAIDVTSSFENWNINEPVKLAEINATQYLTEEQFEADEGKAFLETLDKNRSLLYDILVNDLKVNDVQPE